MADLEYFEDFHQDFVIYRECKEILLREVGSYEDNQENRTRAINGYYTERSDGSKLRMVMPHGGTVIRDIAQRSEKGECKMFFVGFVGFAREDCDPDVIRAIWDNDQKLVTELQNHTDIVSYLTTERYPGGDWVNLVLFTHPRAVDAWNNAQIHSDIVKTFSARLYQHIRIHRGVLDKGLSSDRFGVQRTLFLKYGSKEFSLMKRFVKMWGDEKIVQMENSYTL